MAMTAMTYRGRRLWIDPYQAGEGWYVKAEIWEAQQGGLVKDQLTLPANYSFRSAKAARAFAERVAKRGIDRRAEVSPVRLLAVG